MTKRDWNKWTEEEERIFQKALKKYGKDFEAISELMQTRSYRQVRSHYYNSQKQLKEKNIKENKYQLICYDNM
ncbi:Conserved_hypothetical protein [Hexamita inflata]|uniref:Uncharacterized protein n=1 Tax=Hexamita inflata TaxID=28002 RepID=A0AA86TJU2_9EUKA|nr:Conserved hypothetical protein [Hexamita inflata]